MDIKGLYEIFKRSNGVTTDSRKIEPGSIFFALKGASFDGNDFAVKALEQGAAVAVIDSEQVARQNPELSDRLWLCDNTLTALQRLAQHHRRELGIPILSIAGSNGKTTTKELTHRVIARKFRSCATVGNLNNHIGVPLTLLSIGSECEFAVVEMGASACGEIAMLCEIAEPNYGILTNVGRSHLEGFGGVEGIRRGKGELYDYLTKSGGTAFVPQEDATLCEMASERNGLRVCSYSTSISEGVVNHLEGDFNRLNIAAAMAVGRFFDIEEEQIRQAIASYEPDNNRSQRTITERNTLIMDCYNANPSSMTASISHFAGEELGGRSGKVMILGDMLELGEWSDQEHRTILDLALRSSGCKVLLVGELFQRAYASAGSPSSARAFAKRDELMEYLDQNPISDGLILIKGSRGIGLEKCATKL